MQPRLNVNHAVALLAVVLALAVFQVMNRFGAPSKIAWGSAILSILCVSIFWSAINLEADDEDDD